MIHVAKPTAAFPKPLAMSPTAWRSLTQSWNCSSLQLFFVFASSQDRLMSCVWSWAWADTKARNTMGRRSRDTLLEIILMIYLTIGDGGR